MEKPLWELKDPENLTLISKSKNKPGQPVYREDLPPVLYNRAPRVIKGFKWFNQFSGDQKTGVCESCHIMAPLERHELYGLYKYKDLYLIKFEGVMKICKNCHCQVHGGFSNHLALRYGQIKEPAPVSDALDSKKYPWNNAAGILIEGWVYKL